MSDEQKVLEGPDLGAGIALSDLADGAMLLGHADGEPVLLARRGNEVLAIGAVCTHYGGPLAEGLLVNDTVRCPWHHACFSLRSGEPVCAPVLNPVDCFRVEQHEGLIRVRGKRDRARPPSPADAPAIVVIVGGGAAGNWAAQTLRREGYSGHVALLSADAPPPCGRPNRSKNFLAGTADEAFNMLQSDEFYAEHDIDLRLGIRVTAIDAEHRQVELADGSRHSYGTLLLATGAKPIRLDVPGADLPNVHHLRTLADCRALLAKALKSRRAVVIGASPLGREVAASLRAGKLGVGRQSMLMDKVLGAPVGRFLRKLHEDHGVVFHLDATVSAIAACGVALASGEEMAADPLVVGIGVSPAAALAEQAGLAMDRDVVVNEYPETGVAGIFAAGDIARWPDPLGGKPLRLEHWVAAERLGQVAARNMLGRRERFDDVPFFWTEQYDFRLDYVGHAEHFDDSAIDGDLETRDCTITYRASGRKLGVAVVHRDLEGLREERQFERVIAARA